jgi:hypothetical protein
MVWACAFFGYFSFEALRLKVLPYLGDVVTKLFG